MVGRMTVDGRSIEVVDGDSVAIAVVRAGEPPGRGGTLCLAGDCGNCLAVVDGVAYTRTCQVAARDGMVVERHPVDGNPPLPAGDYTVIAGLYQAPSGARLPVTGLTSQGDHVVVVRLRG